MLCKTHGVVLRRIKYGETSIVVNVLTRAFGLRSYIIKGARSRKSYSSVGFFQVLSRLEMVVYERPNASLQHVREVKRVAPFLSLVQEARAAARILFLAEFLSKVLRSGIDDGNVFSFVWQEVPRVFSSSDEEKWFPLAFLFKLLQHLGVGSYSGQALLEQLRQKGIHITDHVHAKRVLDALLDDSATFCPILKGLCTAKHAELWQSLTKAAIDFYSLQLGQKLVLRSFPMLCAVAQPT